MINYLVLKQDEVEENHVDDCFRSPEKTADFRSEKSADFRFDQKLKKLSKRPRRTKRQQQIDTEHQNTQEVEPNLSQQTGTVYRFKDSKTLVMYDRNQVLGNQVSVSGTETKVHFRYRSQIFFPKPQIFLMFQTSFRDISFYKVENQDLQK